MSNYNLQRAPKNIEKRFYNAYREDLEKIGVTQQDIDQKGVPDLDKTKPPKGNWSDGYVTETGISYLEDALREYYNKPLIEETIKNKITKQRGAFRTIIKGAGAPEEITSLFKTIASLPPKEKEKVGEVIEEVTKKTPKKRGLFRSKIKGAGIDDELSNLFKFVESLPTPKKEEKIEKIVEEIQDIEESDEKISPELSALIDEVVNQPSKKKKISKPKRTRAKRGQLSKRQEELLHSILSDLIKIKLRLVEIKKNQEDKVAYEKRRDRLQAERIAFAQREREIEALPQSEEKKSEQAGSKVADSVKKAVGTSLLSGLAGAILSFGGGGQSPTPGTPGAPGTPGTPGAPGTPGTPGAPGKSEGFNTSTFAKTALKMLPIPGIGAIPFAEGGSIMPIGSNVSGTQIQPLETAMKSPSGGTTFSRGFSMDDLKSPLAEVMKLPLKVAGAALLSAISKLASQFDISDSKLQSDLSKMIGDVSKAFGLTRPTFGGISVTKQDLNITGGDKDNEQAKLALSINNVANSLVGTGETSAAATSPGTTPSGATTSPGTSTGATPPAVSGGPGSTGSTTPLSGPAVSGGPDLPSLSKSVDNAARQGQPAPYIGGSTTINQQNVVASANQGMEKPLDNIPNSASTSNNISNTNQYTNNSTFSPANTFVSSASLNFASPLTEISNSTYFDKINELKYNPAGKPSTSISVAMGLPPIESVRELTMPNNINVINLPTKYNKPQINNQESSEQIFRTGKSPSGYTNIATSIRSQVLA